MKSIQMPVALKSGASSQVLVNLSWLEEINGNLSRLLFAVSDIQKQVNGNSSKF